MFYRGQLQFELMVGWGTDGVARIFHPWDEDWM